MAHNRSSKSSQDRQEKLKRLRSSNKPIWALLGLLAVLGILLFFFSNINKKQAPPKLSKKHTPITAKSYILENTYYNQVYNFHIAIPTKDWQFKKLKDTEPLSSEQKDEKRSYLAQTRRLLKIEKWNKEELEAVVEVGIVPLPGPRNAKTVAVESYMEYIVEDSYVNVDTKTWVKPTAYSSGPLKSAYYAVVSPGREPFDTITVVFVVRDIKAYVMVAKVNQKDYDTYKWDFEQIFNSFNYIR